MLGLSNVETVLMWAQESENRVGRRWEGTEWDMGLRCQQLVFELCDLGENSVSAAVVLARS